MPITREDFNAQFGVLTGFAEQDSPRATRGWVDRLGASVDRAQAGLYGVAEAFGADTADSRRRNESEADYIRNRAIHDTGAPVRLGDINNAGSLIKGIAGLAVDSAPELGVSLATGGLGGLAGLGTVGRLGLAAAASSPSALGDILQNQREESGTTDLRYALPLTVPYVAADMVGLDSALASGKTMRTGINALDRMAGWRGGLARAGANTALNAVAEGAGETGQEFVNQAGRIGVNPNQTFFNGDANERYLESFAGGALLGGGLSAPMGSWRRSEGYKINARGRGADFASDVPNPDQTTPRDWTTTRGFEDLQREAPQFSGETPDWGTSQGFEGVTAIPRGFDLLNKQRPTTTQIPAIDTDGLYLDHTEQLPLNNVKLANDLGVQNLPPVRNTFDNTDAQSMDFTPTTAYVAGDGEVSGMGGIGGRPGQGSYMSDEDMLNDPGAAVARAAQMKEQQRLAEIKKTALARAEEIKVQEAAAAEFKIKGTKGIGLFVELNKLHAAGEITDGELAENIGLLGAKHNGSVEKWIKAQAIAKQTLADSNKADKDAVMTALLKKEGKNVSTAPAAGTVAGNAGQQPGPVNAGSQPVSGSQPAGGTGGGSVLAARTDGASKTSVAVQPEGGGTAAVKTTEKAQPDAFNGIKVVGDSVTLTHNGKKKVVSLLNFRRLQRVLGMDDEGNFSLKRMTYEEAGTLENMLREQEGKQALKNPRESIGKSLAQIGVSQGVIDTILNESNTFDSERTLSVTKDEEGNDIASDVKDNLSDDINPMTSDEAGDPYDPGDPLAGLVEPDSDKSSRGTGYRVAGSLQGLGGSGVVADNTYKSAKPESDLKASITNGPTQAPAGMDKKQVLNLVLKAEKSPRVGEAHRFLAKHYFGTPEGEHPRMARIIADAKAKEAEVLDRRAERREAQSEAAKKAEAEQLARNLAITAENERRMAEFEAEVEKAEGLRDILGDRVSNGDILDAEESWGEYAVDGDPSWDDLTEREQANWVQATIARYSVKPESTHSAEKAYGQKFDDIADGARNRIGKAENASGSRAVVGGSVAAAGGKVSESSTRGSAATASGQEAPSGEAPRGTGSTGSGADQARSGPVTQPTVTIKKKRTIVKPDGGTKFSTNPTEGGSTVDQVYREFAELGIRPNSRKVVVVQSVGDVPQSVRGQVGRKSAATGSRVSAFVSDGKAWFIADNIPQGKARSKFMHEVGSHLGLDGLLTEQQMDNLFATIVKWADKNDSSQESKLARQAIARTGMAVTPDEDIQSEVIAYFIEEALDAGIDPTAMSYKGELARWFRALYAAFKSAIRKLSWINAADKLTAQDVVDLAYGAAKLEMEGTWHGTAADFRKFDHRYMGSGEGAQAYGWGSYLAQRPGIAKGYWEADVARKGVGDPRNATYDGTPSRALSQAVQNHGWGLRNYGVQWMLDREAEALDNLAPWEDNPKLSAALRRMAAELRAMDPDKVKVAPDGNLMRTDVNVAEDEWLYLDKPLSEQPKVLEKIGMYMPSDLQEALVNEVIEDIDQMTGHDLYFGLKFIEERGGAVSEYFDVDDYNKRLAGKSPKQIVSTYLDEQLGIKGNKFLDARSRSNSGDLYLNGKKYTRDELVAIRKDADHPLSPYAVTLRQVLRNGVQSVLSELEREVANTTDMFERNALESAERYGVKIDPAKERAKAEQQAAETYEGEQLQWLRDNANRITIGEPNKTHNFVVFNDKNIQRVMSLRGADREKVKFSIAPTLRDTARRVGGSTGAMLYEDAAHQATKAVRSLAFLHDLVDEYKDKMPSVKEWYRSMQATVSARMEMEEPAERVAAEALKLKDGAGKVNALVAKATTQQKWPYDPKIAGRPVTPDPVLAREFEALSKEERKVVEDIFAHGEHMRQYEQDLMTRLDLGGILTAYTKLDGPYAPLKRFGNYITILKSQELRDAEQNDDKKKVEELKKDPKHYTVSFFDTKGLAMEFANINDKANGGAYDFSTYGEKDVRVGEEMPTDHTVIQRVLGAIKGGDLDPKAKEAATNLIRDMYFQSIDEHHARVHGLKRKNIAGYSEDMVRAFLHHARAQANFLANLEHGGETNEQFYAMKKEARKSANDKLDNQDIVNTFAAHYEESLKYKETPIQDRMMALTSAWQLATSVGYHLANFMQPIMATLPKLASDFNDYSGAWKHLLDAYGTLKTTGIRGHLSLDGIRDEGLQATLQRAVELQLMDMGMDSDISSFEATHTGIAPVDAASRGVKTALHKLRQVSRAVETANRVSSAVAAYNMARQKGKTEAQAQEYAINILQTTQGDSTRMGAPLLLKRLPKIMTQYKKFQFMMAAMYVKAFRQAFKGATAEERAIGRRMLAYKLFHTSMAAGVMGMPLMNLVQIVFNMLGADGDEPPDFERWLKEQGAPDALLHGPLSFMGTDAKLGEEKVFSILPYADWDITSATGVKNMVAGLLGPAVSQGLKVADGIGAIKNGDYYKGVEKMMPSGVANGMKAFRVANDGYTLKNGDVMFKPDDINGAVLALDALGLPSSQMKNMEWLRSQQYQIGKFYNDRSKTIERDYLKAFKDGDTDAMMEARESWLSLQAGKDEMRHWFGDSADELKRQPLSVLIKYPQTVAKREGKLQKGALVE